VGTPTNDAGLSLGTRPAAVVLEVVAWALLALVGALSVRAYRPTPLLDDSYQYLNVAEHFARGQGLTTSLVHFDAERSHGRIPAPVTTFPPGYPVVLAAVGEGRDLEAAARLVSCVCYAGTAAFLAWALILTGVTAVLRQVVMLLFATNAVALSFAASVLSEPLYMLLSTGSVVGLIWAEQSAQNGLPHRSVIAGAVMAYSAAGIAYWVRYAGLFLIVALAGYAVLQLIRQRSRLRGVLLATALIPPALAAGLMLRNVVTVGTWKGGNDMAVHNSVKTVAADYVRAHFHLLLGVHAVKVEAFAGLLVAGVLGLVLLALAAVSKRGAQPQRTPNAAALLVGFCILIYSAGMFYAGLSTVISFGTRMFLPVLPVYLLLLGMGLHWLTLGWPARSRIVSPMLIALLIATAGYAGVNARDFLEPHTLAPHQILATLYAQPTAGGQPLLEWVDANIRTNDVIVATDGQATGYLLHRPTISMIGAHYSPVRWECEEVKKQMQRFTSSYAIVYKPPSTPSLTPSDGFLLDESRFVAAAAMGEPPCGFVAAAENSAVRILKLGAAEPAPERY
jgi:hypothetical protein